MLEKIVDVERLNRHLSELKWSPTVEISRSELLAVLSRLEQAERELVAVKSTQVQHIVTTSFETARTAGIALDEAVKLVAGWLVDDPDRRAREAEQAVARVREFLEYRKANSAVARDGLRALDGDTRG